MSAYHRMKSRLEQYGIHLILKNDGAAYFGFAGENLYAMYKAREYIKVHPSVLEDFAQSEGVLYKTDLERGAVSSEHELDVWGAFIMPLGNFDENVRDYWTERRAVVWDAGGKIDFHSLWMLNVPNAGYDASRFWFFGYELPKTAYTSPDPDLAVNGYVWYKDIRGEYRLESAEEPNKTLFYKYFM